MKTAKVLHVLATELKIACVEHGIANTSFNTLAMLSDYVTVKLYMYAAETFHV